MHTVFIGGSDKWFQQPSESPATMGRYLVGAEFAKGIPPLVCELFASAFRMELVPDNLVMQRGSIFSVNDPLTRNAPDFLVDVSASWSRKREAQADLFATDLTVGCNELLERVMHEARDRELTLVQAQQAKFEWQEQGLGNQNRAGRTAPIDRERTIPDITPSLHCRLVFWGGKGSRSYSKPVGGRLSDFWGSELNL